LNAKGKETGLSVREYTQRAGNQVNPLQLKPNGPVNCHPKLMFSITVDNYGGEVIVANFRETGGLKGYKVAKIYQSCSKYGVIFTPHCVYINTNPATRQLAEPRCK